LKKTVNISTRYKIFLKVQ